MSKSAIYTANTGNQILDVGSQIDLGSIIRRFGCNIGLAGNGITILGNGYYKIDIAVTATPTAAGEVTVTLYKDGVAVQGATASDYNTAGNPSSLSITSIVRETCCDNASIYTLVFSGSAGTVNNVGVTVVKL